LRSVEIYPNTHPNHGDSGIAYQQTLVIIGPPILSTMVFLGSAALNRLKYTPTLTPTMVILGSLISKHW
ncbi:hypothetical protein, partial [Vibrio parahaemolyticus]|uniref:hypothetical protein n=1 Tax=Vibrio parahaemolyticus TaxID=670 RepID=UPI001E491193